MADDIRANWNFADPASSEVRFRQLAFEAQGADRMAYLTQVARAQGLQRHFEEAIKTLDALPAPGSPPLARWEAYALLERGRVLNSSGQPNEARPWFEGASDTPHEDLRIDALHMLAIVSEPDEAIRLNEQAISEARASEDPAARRWLGSLLNNLGWTYHDRGEFALALERFEEARDERRRAGDAEGLRVAEWCVGRCLRSLGRLDEALAAQTALLKEGATDDGYVAEEMAECLFALERVDDARPWFHRSAELLGKMPGIDPQRLDRLRMLAGTES